MRPMGRGGPVRPTHPAHRRPVVDAGRTTATGQPGMSERRPSSPTRSISPWPAATRIIVRARCPHRMRWGASTSRRGRRAPCPEARPGSTPKETTTSCPVWCTGPHAESSVRLVPLAAEPSPRRLPAAPTLESLPISSLGQYPTYQLASQINAEILS